MTRKALIERPEDPRTARLRKELDDLTRLDEKKSQESVRRIRDLEEALKAARTENPNGPVLQAFLQSVGLNGEE
ncbi:MAG: hypothetical protein EOM91_11280 [Sphingobacteriia bacterium]|nr:hypothetical protein [Sphingobacteriia bacterium]